MKKKLKLNELNVQSFITSTEKEIKGGAATEPCTIHACRTIPVDQCPTTDNQCPTVQRACGSNPLTDCITPIIDVRTLQVNCNFNTMYCTPPHATDRC